MCFRDLAPSCPVSLRDLPTTAVRVKHLQYNEYANRPAFGYICFSELRNAVSRRSSSFAEVIKVCSVFPNLYKAKGVTFRAFLLLVTATVSLTLIVFATRLSRRVTLLFCSNISIAKVSRMFYLANGTVRLDQGSFFRVFTLKWFLRFKS